MIVHHSYDRQIPLIAFFFCVLQVFFRMIKSQDVLMAWPRAKSLLILFAIKQVTGKADTISTLLVSGIED